MLNNSRIIPTRYNLKSPKIKGEIKIAHLSDLHEKRFGPSNTGLFNILDREKPDVIMLTGDIAAHEYQQNSNIGYTEELANGLSNIAPTFFVTGNHERMFDLEIKSALKKYGVTVLAGENVKTAVRGNNMTIAGIDDLSYGFSDLEKIPDMFTEPGSYNIFLSHQPQVFPHCLNKNIDLILAGHTHAGQIRLPVISRIYMSGQGFFPKYMEGKFTKGGTTMLISRGLGASGYPTVRFNNPPDLVLANIKGTA